MLRVKEAAALVGVHPSTIYRWVAEGVLEHVRYGKPRPAGTTPQGRGGAIRIPEDALPAVQTTPATTAAVAS